MLHTVVFLFETNLLVKRAKAKLIVWSSFGIHYVVSYSL